MSATLKPFLSKIGFHAPQAAGNVAIVQLTGTDPDFPPLTPFDLAYRTGLVELAELEGGGSASEIRARNLGTGYILLLEGEVLAGAKQNRTVNTSVLLPPQSTTVIPVSCIERGRWSGRTDRFTPSGDFVTPDMRAKKIRSTLQNLDASGSLRSDQGEVWEGVFARIAFMNIGSATGNFSDIAGAKKDTIDDILLRFPRHPGTVGIVGLIGGRVVGCDIVPEPGIFAGYYDRFVRSYALDGMYLKFPGGAGDGFQRLAAAFIDRIASCPTELYAPPGAGSSIRLCERGVSGSALTFGGSMLHLGAFELAERGR